MSDLQRVGLLLLEAILGLAAVALVAAILLSVTGGHL